MQEAMKDISTSAKEIIIERLFNPLYFYFILSWCTFNWKFLYVLLRTDEKFLFDKKKLLKVEYLSNLYDFDWISFCKLFIFPLLSAFFVVWGISILSRMFIKRHEQHKIKIRSIKKKLEYKEKISYEQEQRKIRDAKSDQPTMRYEDNPDFNISIDNSTESLEVSGVGLIPSEALYNSDFEAYKEQLHLYKDEQNGEP